MDDFLLRALLAGFGVALVAAPLGVFVVWRRMAYFGDTLAHSALLGVALGFILGISLNLAVIAVAISMSLLLLMLQNRKQLGGGYPAGHTRAQRPVVRPGDDLLQGDRSGST